jgi:hypothetical protein
MNVKYLTNSVLKSYDEMFTFSEYVLQRVAYSKMINYYDNLSLKESGKKDNITSPYQSKFINIHKNEYNKK